MEIFQFPFQFLLKNSELIPIAIPTFTKGINSGITIPGMVELIPEWELPFPFRTNVWRRGLEEAKISK